MRGPRTYVARLVRPSIAMRQYGRKDRVKTVEVEARFRHEVERKLAGKHVGYRLDCVVEVKDEA